MGTIICTKCHKEHQDTCKFCDNCGNTLTLPTTQTTENGSTAKMKYDVVIEKVGSRKLSVISAIRILTDYSLQEAKTIVEGRSKIVMQGVSKETAKKAKDELQKAGAFVNITSYEIYESKPNTPEGSNYANTDDNIEPVPESANSINSESNIKSSDPVVATVQKQAPSTPEKNKNSDPKPKYQTADKDLVEIIKNANREIKGCKIIKIISKILSITTFIISAIIFVVSLLLFGALNLIITFISSLISLMSGADFGNAFSPFAHSVGSLTELLPDSLSIPIVILILFLIFISMPLSYISQKIMMSHIKKNGYDKYKTLEIFMDNANRENQIVDAAFDIYPFIENTGKTGYIIKKLINFIYVTLIGLPVLFSILGHRLLHIPFNDLITHILSMLDQSTDIVTVNMYRSISAAVISFVVLLVVLPIANKIKQFIMRKIKNIQLKKWINQ